MNKTILSKKELEILEEIISNLGNIVYFDDIKKLLEKEYSVEEIRRRISILSRRGWLVRIKRGVFAVASLESHNFTNVSPLMVSQVLVRDSYVSFEFALAHYGLFDQLPKKLTAITPVKPKTFTFQGIEYQYRKIKPELYFGYESITLNNSSVNIAELEKAILDFLYFRIDTYSVDLVLEKLKDTESDIDTVRLLAFARKYPLSVKRRLGFLLDLTGASNAELYSEVRGKPGFSKLTKTSDKFSAKWRIYHEDRFVE